jgi:two-component system, chemotaxis family, sensor kinase CheA
MIDVHRETFKVEAQELLIELETALLELDRKPGEMELIQRTFRALHTIKGSGAMFGFDAISKFTHQLETVFDQVRDGRLRVTADLINLTLAARDQIRGMLEENAQPHDAERSAEILEKLQAFVIPSGRGPAPSAPPAAAQIAKLRRFRILFRPFHEILLQGANPLLLFRELLDFGRLEVRADVTGFPQLKDMDPESSYLGWDLLLETQHSMDMVRGVFIFFEGDCDLTIEEQPGAGEEQAEQLPAVIDPTEAADSSAPLPTPKKEPWTLGSLDTRRDAYSAGGDKISIRVALERVDKLINFVGELVTVQARLSQIAAVSETPELRLIAEEVDRLSSGLRENAMSMRMLPLKATFERFRRLVHDLTRDLGKEVEFSTEGADTELDKIVIDQLNDPLLHLIRNSMDHGIGSPEERVAAAKPRAGRIRLSAAYSGANVLISVADDGKGLNVDAIRARAVEKGLIASDAQLSDAEIHALIMAPGFSTAKQVTDLSGRGVGMDVVRRNVEALRGLLEIHSLPGRGTTITLRLPLTLAIIDGLLVRVDAAHFVIPLSNVLECVELTTQDLRQAHGKPLANLRGELVPYIRLREYFLIPGERPSIEQIILVESAHGRYGFAVDEVLGDHQTVIKNLGRLYRDVHVVSGATILGNGSVALILDPHRLVQNAVLASSHGKRSNGRERRPANGVPAGAPQPISRKEDGIHVT